MFSDVRNKYLIGILLVITTAIAYWQVLGNGFVSYDDYDYVTTNPNVKTGLSVENVKWAFTHSRCSNWHPLTWISHMADVQIYGLNPMGHHLTNLLLHILAVLLLFIVLCRMTGSIWKSGFVAALFALHPLHVESVAWVAERKDVLSTVFWLLTMLAYLNYVNQRCSPSFDKLRMRDEGLRMRDEGLRMRALRSKRNILNYLLVFVLYALGLMAKPMLVTLPLVLLMLDYWPLGRAAVGQPAPVGRTLLSGAGQTRVSALPWYTLVLEKVPLFALAAASSVVTFVVQQRGGSVAQLESYTIGVRLANALVAYVSYLIKTFVPIKLAVFYPHPKDSLPDWQVIGSAILLIVLTILALKASRKRPYLGVGWLWYVVTLIPVVGLVQVGRQAMADRYTYVPLIGIFMILAWGIPELLPGREQPAKAHKKSKKAAEPESSAIVLAAPAVVVLLILTGLTWTQTATWRDTETLFMHATNVTRNNYVAHTNLGEALLNEGSSQEAAEHFKEALKVAPDSAEANNNLGQILMREGRVQEALDRYMAAVKSKPDSTEIHFNIGAALVQLGRVDEGIKEYREALRLRPEYAEVRNNLGLALDKQGKTAEAEAEISKAIELDPSSASAYNNLGSIYLNHNQLDKAAEQLRKAAELKPDYGPTHNNLAAVHFFKGNYAEAWKEIQLCRQYGTNPSPALVEMLARKMAEPK